MNGYTRASMSKADIGLMADDDHTTRYCQARAEMTFIETEDLIHCDVCWVSFYFNTTLPSPRRHKLQLSTILASPIRE